MLFSASRRSLALLAVFAVGAGSGSALAPSPGITQDVSAGRVAEFAAALESRVAALEDLLLTHIGADTAGPPPKEGGVVLKAPFTIVDSSNHPVFTVDADDGGGIVQVMHGGSVGVTLDGGRNRVVVADDAQGEIELGKSEADAWGLFVREAGGNPMSNLAKEPGKGMALRVFSDGNPAVSVGMAPGTGGLIRTYAPGGTKITVALDSYPDGTGSIQVAGKQGEGTGITLDGRQDLVLVKSDKGTAALGGDKTGWGMVVGDAGGTPEASVSNTGGGMALRVFQGGTEVLAAGNAPGAGASVRLFAPSGSNAGASMSISSDGSGTIQAADGSGSKGIKLDGQNKLLLIQADEGSVDIGKTGSGWGMLVGDAAGQPMADLAEPQGRGMALRIYNKGAAAAQIGTAPGAGGLLRLIAGGEKIAVKLDSNPDGTGMIQVAGTEGEDMGIKLDGQKNLLSLDTAKGTAGLGDVDAGWGIEIGEPGGRPLADFARADGKGMAMRIYDSEQQAAALGLIPGEGGQLRLYGKDGMAVSAGADAGGGRLQVYKAGAPAAVMNGPQSLVAVVDEAGTPMSMLMIALSGSGGKVQATDPGGNPVFKGGYVPDGPGTACVYNDGTKCLGIGLTGMEGFH